MQKSNQLSTRFTDSQYTGMTVNERLYVSGLLEDFNRAVDEKNTGDIISILKQVGLTDLSIIPILEHLKIRKQDTSQIEE